MALVKKKNIKTASVVPRKQRLPPETFELVQRSVPIICVDLVVLRKVVQQGYEALLIKRKIYPERGTWCLIGGRVLKNETILGAIRRQALRELGVRVKILPPWSSSRPILVSEALRADPQKHYVSLLYPVVITGGTIRDDGPEFDAVQWCTEKTIPRTMGFIHKKQLLCAFKGLGRV